MFSVRFIIVFVFTLFLSNCVWTQNPFYKALNVSKGFPCNMVYDVYQSKSGLIWFATDIGLYNFDGFDVTKIESNASSKAVTNILEDREGNIWCQSFRGNFYYTNGDSLVLEPLISGKGSFIAAQMLNGQVLATVIKNGVNLFDVKSKRLKSIDIPNLDIVASTLNYKDTYILNSPSNAKQYEVKANGSIVVNYKKTNTRFYHSAFFNNQLNSISKEYPFIVSGLQGFTKEIIIKTNKEIYINNIRAISNNRLAICTTGGLYLLDENYKVINRVGFYTDVNISNICEDSEGNFWLSTIDNGILVTNQFGIIISHNDYIFETISNYKNILYLGTLDNSIFRLNLETRLLDTIYFTSPKHKISNFLYNPKKDELVFSNFTFNVLKKNKEIISIPLHVNSIDTIDSEHYLIAHREGLCIYPNDNSELINKWKAKAIYSKDKSVLTIASGQAFFTTKCIDGKVYTSTNNELLEFSENGMKRLIYQNKKLEINNLGVINNELVVITYNLGVLKYTTNHLVPFFTGANGMSKSDLYLGKTYENNLFLLLYDGYQKYDPVSKEISLVNMSDGVESDLIDFVVYNDTTYATNFEGILTFKLDGTLASKSRPRLLLSALFVNNIKKTNLSNIECNYYENNIKINYSLIDYKGVKYTKVFYELNNGGWVETKSKNKELLFTALEPNLYTLKLKAINYRGLESEVLTIRFLIAPPFYKTWWFITILGVVIVGVVVLLFYARIKKIQKEQLAVLEKQKMLHELDLSTIKSLRAQMNPHFLYNALNAIQSFIYTGDKQTAIASLGKFSDLSRAVLDSSRNAEISLFDEISLLKNYLELEVMRLPKIKYNMIVDENINLHDTYIPTMIIQPLIENAIYHGLSNKQGEGFLLIDFKLVASKLVIVIHDNGIGREAAAKLRLRALKKSASFSTGANINRIDLINASKENKIKQTITDLYNSEASPIGTKVELIIPINDYD